MQNEYIRYLGQVLGIRSVLLPEEKEQLPASCLFLSDMSSFSQEESELFLKITTAMKLSFDDFELLHLEEKMIPEFIEKIQSAKVLICFFVPLYKYLRVQFPHTHIFLISHPKEMLFNPELKKTAWQELKKAMDFL